MNAAAAGDTIMVGEGEYDEAVIFSQDNITLRAYGAAENTTITQADGTTISFGTTSGGTVDGFTISLTAADNTNDEVIFSNNTTSETAYNTVKNSIINVKNKDATAFGLYGINIDEGNFRLINNTITVWQTADSSVHAIWNSAAHSFELRENTIFVNQDATGAFLTTAVSHAAGAGGILYCIENTITMDSEHTGASIGHLVYAHANLNYVEGNVINGVGAAGVMIGLFTGAGDTAYYNGNFINVTTTDSDGQWANDGAGTSHMVGNTIIGDGIIGIGGTIYSSGNLINDVVLLSGVQLLSVTNVPFDADGDTVLFTVPKGYSCLLDHVKIVAGADAVSTDITVGRAGTENDFIPTNQMDNLDAASDVVIIMPIPNTTPLTLKVYAAETVIEMNVANQAGGATNAVYLYGTLY